MSKLYFQWLLIILCHGLVFFWLPISGNLKLTNRAYCVTGSASCNSFDRNYSLICFYVLCCAYLWVSALQIRDGHPEVMQTMFMMGRYHWLNKAIFMVFLYTPFIFELRTFIDWSFTATSLDVF